MELVLIQNVLGALRPSASDNILRKAAMRFCNSFERGADEECWLWSARRRPSGYGIFNVGTGGGIQATRIMLSAFKGSPPYEGAFALHGCDNPSCVNPAHLRWGTPQDNADDRENRGRSIKPKGVRHGHAKLTDDQVRLIRSSNLSGAEMARQIGISNTVVSLIRRGRIWRHIR